MQRVFKKKWNIIIYFFSMETKQNVRFEWLNVIKGVIMQWKNLHQSI